MNHSAEMYFMCLLICAVIPMKVLGGPYPGKDALPESQSQSENLSPGSDFERIVAEIVAKTELNETTIGKLQDGNFNRLTVQEEDGLGMLISAPVFAVAPILDKPEIQLRLNKLIQRIGARTELPDINWRGALIDSPEINAYSVPGGIVLITSGLYQLLDTEDELAGVVAHEAAHIVKRHHLENLRKSMKVGKGLGRLSSAIGLIEDLAHSYALKNDPQYASNYAGSGVPKLVSSLIGNFAEAYARGLDRDAEYEADRMGVVYMARAGFDPFGYISALLKMEGLSSRSLAAQNFFRTHPSPDSRIEKLEQSIGNHFKELPFARIQSDQQLHTLFPDDVSTATRLFDGSWEVEYHMEGGNSGKVILFIDDGKIKGKNNDGYFSGYLKVQGRLLEGEVKVDGWSKGKPTIVEVGFKAHPTQSRFYAEGKSKQNPEIRYLILFGRK